MQTIKCLYQCRCQAQHFCRVDPPHYKLAMNMFSQAGMLPAAAQCLLLERTDFHSAFNSQGSWWGTGQTQKVAKKAQSIFSELYCST